MAGSDKRQIELDLLARNKMGQGAEAAARDLGKVETAADKLGNEMAKTERQVEKLDKELDEAQRNLAQLAGAFALAETAAERIDLSRGIRKSQSEIRNLSKNKGILEAILPDPGEASKSFFKKFTSSISSSASSLAAAGGQYGTIIAGAAAVTLAPALASALSTAVAGGIGSAGLGAGVALAISKDKGVQEAGKQIGKDFMTSLQQSATTAFAVPLRSALGILDDLADRSAHKLSSVFSDLAPELVPFLRDVAQGADAIITSFANIASRSGPALESLGDTILILSNGVADFLDIITQNSDEAGSALEGVATVITDLLLLAGELINTFVKVADKVGNLTPLMGFFKKHIEDAKGPTDALAGSQSQLAEEMTASEKAAKGELSAMEALSTELRKQTDPVFALMNASDRLSDGHKKAAEAASKYGKNSKEAKAATRDLALAALDLQGAAGKLGGAFNGQLSPQLRATLEAAGLTRKEIKNLERQFATARDKATAFAGNYKANVSAPGAKSTLSALDRLQREVNDLAGNYAVNIAMRVTGTSSVSKAKHAIEKQYQARAAGGPVQAGRPYWVGEEGPELVVPATNGRVMTASASRALTTRGVRSPDGGMAGGGQGGTLRLELIGQQEVVTMFRYLVRTANLLQG